MKVFRLAKEKYAHELSGVGSALRGGRWNSKGVELIYTAENRSLAMAEVAVSFSWATLPGGYVMLTIDIPESLKIVKVPSKELPPYWNSFPHRSGTQQFGDNFVQQNEHIALKVPSVVTQGDYNILINPRYHAFHKIKILKKEAFQFDRRLFSGL